MVEKYNEFADITRRIVWKWYYLGQSFEWKVEAIKYQGKRKKARIDQVVREELYNKMMRYLSEEKKDNEKN